MRELVDAPAASSGSVRFEIGSVDALDGSLGARYDALRAASAELASPFFSLEWLRLVGRHRPATRVAIARRGGTVSGFIGFEVDGGAHGRPIGSTWSDHQGSVGDVGTDVQALLRAAGLRSLRFDHLDPSCRLNAPFMTRRAESPFIDLAGGSDAWAQAVAARSDVVKRTAALRRRVERELGPVRLERHVPDAVDDLLRWKREQYARTAVRDPFDDPRDLALVAASARSPAAPGCEPWLSVLYAGDVALAAHLGLRSGPELAYWLPAYDPAHAARSPGRLLLVELVALAADVGVRRIDLGKGDEDYKQRLATGSATVLSGTVERRSWRKGVRIVRSALSRGAARR